MHKIRGLIVTTRRIESSKIRYTSLCDVSTPKLFERFSIRTNETRESVYRDIIAEILRYANRRVICNASQREMILRPKISRDREMNFFPFGLPSRGNGRYTGTRDVPR